MSARRDDPAPRSSAPSASPRTRARPRSQVGNQHLARVAPEHGDRCPASQRLGGQPHRGRDVPAWRADIAMRPRPCGSALAQRVRGTTSHARARCGLARSRRRLRIASSIIAGSEQNRRRVSGRATSKPTNGLTAGALRAIVRYAAAPTANPAAERTNERSYMAPAPLSLDEATSAQPGIRTAPRRTDPSGRGASLVRAPRRCRR